MEHKRVIGAVFSLGLTGKMPTVIDVAKYLGIDRDYAGRETERLVERGEVKIDRGRVRLTEAGRGSIRVVFIGGGFELIHQGHLYTIEKAKSLGDVLVVSIARDSTIRRRKKREPVAKEEQRVKLLSSLRQVDAAILGVEGDIYETLERVAPDVVALGYDQYHLEAEVSKEATRRGLKLRVV
ncbi:MAG: FAD synthase, partial [Thaumarchaeota archaeon]|nr:FAD synthase [Nitrososphaerota archaeon]